MGFDINILMTLTMCEKTGKPYYYGKKGERTYELPNIVVPEGLCSYLVGRGRIFHAYTEYFNQDDIYNTSVDRFLEHYPSWEEVKKHSSYEGSEYYWTEKDHDNFRLLLEWCEHQEVPFRVDWSY